MSILVDPLTSDLPAEVPLANAPLVRVIAQVRFPQILSIANRDFVASFQEAIRPQYPILRPEQTQGWILGPQGIPAMSTQPQVVWRFLDIEDKWRVSLAQDFVVIETTAYQSRADFFERFEAITRAIAEHVRPQTVDRIGVRYIDRIVGDALGNISTLVRPEVLGFVATDMAQHAQRTLSESVFSAPVEPNAQLLARWGLLPPGGTVDPAAIEPVPESSWILDLDMFSLQSRTFAPDELVAGARSYAERIYAFFRWAVTEDFLSLYGGTV